MSNYPPGVTDNDPYFNDDPDGECQEQPCGLCDGTGEVRASREMALDAGDPELEGTRVACWACAEEGADREARYRRAMHDAAGPADGY